MLIDTPEPITPIVSLRAKLRPRPLRDGWLVLVFVFGSCSCSARGKNALKSELPNVGMPDVGDPGMPSRRSGVLLPIDSVEPQQPSDGVVAQLLCGGSPTLVADFPAIEPFGNTCEQSDP